MVNGVSATTPQALKLIRTDASRPRRPDLIEDLAEINELGAQNPEKYHELMTDWREFAAEIQVQFPAPRQVAQSELK